LSSGARISTRYPPIEAAGRGIDVVISNLGGDAHEVECPSCEGDGVRLLGDDAQARWRERAAEA
jgi:hypothetical protein